jgi:acetylornithine deacetylase
MTKSPYDPNTLNPVELLANLVAIPSVNPDLVQGGNGETAIAEFIGAWFHENGFEVHRLEHHAGRPSIVGIARGTGGGRSLMFNGHIDTVTLAGYDGDPLDPVIRDGKLYGRGSFDMKGGVAAMMVAAARARDKGIMGDILVACVADEEYASFGTEEVAAQFKADAAIVTEPSHLEVTIAHRGFVWFDVEVNGRAAHGSRPELGIDAIAKAGKFLVALEDLDKRLRVNPAHVLLKSGSVHASIISGGEELSSYPAKCLIRLERRTIPGETVAGTQAELQKIIDTISAADPDFKARVTAGLARPPFEIGENEPIVQALRNSATARLGKKPDWRGEPFWTDCAILQAAGIACVMFGVDGGGAHAATEWTTTESVEALADILTATALQHCNQIRSQ